MCQTVYKLFLGRRELVEASAVARIGELADEIAGGEWSETSDAELADLHGEGSPVTLHDALWLGAVREPGLLFWTAWFDRARAAGLLRHDVSERAISDWPQTIYASLVLRHSLDAGGAQEIIERFVLPSVLAS